MNLSKGPKTNNDFIYRLLKPKSAAICSFIYNCVPNCVAILPALSSGYQTLPICEMFNLDALRDYSVK